MRGLAFGLDLATRPARAVLAAVLIILAALAGLSEGVRAAPAAQGGNQSSCSDLDPETRLPLSTRVISPSAIRLCDTATVSLTARVSCEASPLHIFLNIDKSGSMVGQPMNDAKAAARALVDTLEMDENPQTQVGLVSHGIQPNRDVRLTNNAGTVKGGIGRLGAGGEDNLPAAITMAANELVQARSDTSVEPVDVMVILSDAGQTFPPQEAVRAARQARGRDILIVAVCLDNGSSDCPAMRQMASSPQYFFESRGTSGLTRIFRQIAEEVRDIRLRSLTVEETLPEGLSYIEGSAVPEADYDAGSRKLTWSYQFVGGAGLPMGYQVRPSAITTYTVAEKSLVTYRDSRNRLGRIAMPTAVLTVPIDCLDPGIITPTPTPTDPPTATPTPTDTPTPTPTDTPSPTPTATPTNTPTPPPSIYLPILNLSRCLDRDRPAEIALVIDASTSMSTFTSAGRTRLQAAQEGARAFVDRMRAVDRVALFSFNDSVQHLTPLTDDREALKAAIDGIQLAPFTRIDLALDAAAAELGGGAVRPEAKRVIVLLTDGEPTNTTPAAVRAAAERARAGTTVFTIGVGPSVDPALMVDVAGAAERYFPVADAESLASIYTRIAEKIACEGG